MQGSAGRTNHNTKHHSSKFQPMSLGPRLTRLVWATLPSKSRCQVKLVAVLGGGLYSMTLETSRAEPGRPTHRHPATATFQLVLALHIQHMASESPWTDCQMGLREQAP